MTEEFHIYMLPEGKMAIPFVTTKNAKYLAQCIDKVVRESS